MMIDNKPEEKNQHECLKSSDCSCMNEEDIVFLPPNQTGKLEFNLQDPESETRFKRAVRADEAFSLLWDIDNECRNCLKYGTENASDVLEKIRDMINETDLMDLYA